MQQNSINKQINNMPKNFPNYTQSNRKAQITQIFSPIFYTPASYFISSLLFIFILNIMGNKSNLQRPPELQYHSTVQHQLLGPCQVYSSNKFASCYIIKVVTPFSDSNQLQLFSHIQNQQNIYLIGLYGYRIGKNCHCTTQLGNVVTECAISFWEFLSFSLRNTIEQRISLKIRFQQDQIWHLIKASLHGYGAFSTLRICYDFKPSKILINKDGRIRLDWMHIQPKNMHSQFLNKISNNSIILGPQQFLAPQQLQAISLKQFTPKINFEKANIFSLGMMLLQCITLLNPTKHFYQQMKIIYPKIQEVMSSKHCKVYSETLLKLVGTMLRPQATERPLFQMVGEKYSSYLKRDYCINIIKPSPKGLIPAYKPLSNLTTKYQ